MSPDHNFCSPPFSKLCQKIAELLLAPFPFQTSDKDPIEVIYNIHRRKFAYKPRSELITSDAMDFMELPEDNPPLLVDGKKQIMQIPKFHTKVRIHWRFNSGGKTSVRVREVKLPSRVIM